MTNETKAAYKSTTIIALVVIILVGVVQGSGIVLDVELLPSNLQEIVPAIIVLLSALVAMVGRITAKEKIDRPF